MFTSLDEKGKDMLHLNDLSAGQTGTITGLDGDERFVSRVTSIGLTPGCTLRVLQNEKKQPILVYARHTRIAINRKESEKIEIGGGSNGK